MKIQPFPAYKKFDDAVCFKCEAGPFPKIEHSGYAQGQGEFVASCPECYVQTWFDLKPLERCCFCGTNGDHYCPADVATD